MTANANHNAEVLHIKSPGLEIPAAWIFRAGLE